MRENNFIDLEQPIESEVKRQEVDKTRKIVLVHRRGMDVVANENTREHPELLEIRLLNGKGHAELKRTDEGFVFDVFNRKGEVVASTWVHQNDLEGEDE